jgi:uncharacterized protein YdeI (YjbR/CyaY-like superfamily)
MMPTFFATPEKLRKWFEQNHKKTSEFWVGFYKRSSGKPSITWPESVDAALCFGWIDGLRKSIDEVSYMIRFTPRKPKSTWSNINIKRVSQLIELGLMQPAGLAAFEKRKPEKSGIYGYERKSDAKLDPEYEKKLRANRKALKFFESQAPWYQRICAHWIMSAKQHETRLRRLDRLIQDSENGQKIQAVDISRKSK